MKDEKSQVRESNQKVAIFVGSFSPLSETFIVTQAAALVDAGMDVRIFAETMDVRGLSHPESIRTSLLRRTSFGSKTILYLLAQKIRRPYRLRRWLQTIGQRQADKASEDFDVNLCHFGPNGNRALKLKQRGRLKGQIWTVFHGYDLSRILIETPINPYVELLAEGDLFFPVSEYWSRVLKGLGCPAERIVVHHMGVDSSAIPFMERHLSPGDPIKIYSVCRLVEKKGIEFALRALSRVRNLHPSLKWNYKIAGDGPLAKSLEALTDSF